MSVRPSDKSKKRIRRQFIDVDYGQLHLRVAAPVATPVEPPLICLHQSPKSGREFLRFLDAASDQRLLIAPDYPGHGESDLPPADPVIRIEDYAHCMWQALDALSLPHPVDLFGHHTGGAVAVEMANQQPNRVRHIAMISASVLTHQEQVAFDDYFQPIDLDVSGTRFQTMWQRINEYRSPGFTLEMMAASFAENLRAGDAYEWGHRAAFAYNDAFISRIAELDHQIVVLNPADLLYEITARVEPLLKNGKVIDLPNWGSGILDIYPREVYRLLLDGFS